MCSRVLCRNDKIVWQHIPQERKTGRSRNEPFGSHTFNLNVCNRDLQARRLRILNTRVLIIVLLHLLVHHISGLLDNLVDENCGPFTHVHFTNHPVVDVQEVLGPGKSHQFQDFKELGNVEILDSVNDIDHFIELVLIVALDGCANITD